MTWFTRRAFPKSGASLVIAAILGGIAVWVVNPGRVESAAPASPPMRLDAVSAIARDRARSVVFLHAVERGATAESATPSTWFLNPIGEVLGSGIVLDSAGLILTNAHVVRSATAIHVRRPEGDDVVATLVGIDRDSDLALVRSSDPTGLVAAPLGDSDTVDVGSFVVAIGSPLGLHHTVTAGVLSAKARGIDDSGVEFLQTDAAVNPGSSGGPLFDLSGRVIGVITAIASERGENVGLNFAIPINTAKELLPALRTDSVTHPWLGVETRGLTAAGARAFGLRDRTDGLAITAVQPSGPASAAGVLPGDVLLGLVGDPPVRAVDVYRRIRVMEPGATIRLRLFRDGKTIERAVVLGSRQASR